jgi:hypothetical protein
MRSRVDPSLLADALASQIVSSLDNLSGAPRGQETMAAE